MQVKDLIIETLEQYDIGLMLNDVKIQDSEPPTEEVTAAFKNVETAKQGAETVVNEAKAYQNAELPAAEAQADQLIQNAEYLKQKRINEAREQVAMFEARYEEYAQNPAITRSRMYYEAITEALPDVQIYMDLSEGDLVKVLPLDEFANAEEAGSVTSALIPDVTEEAGVNE